MSVALVIVAAVISGLAGGIVGGALFVWFERNH